MAGNDKGKNSTASNALEVLSLFSADQKTITAIQIAHHLDTSRSTAYRYLDTLLAMDFLAPDPAGGYRIGQRILELARLDQASDRALALAKDWMVRIKDEFNETVTYTARLGRLRTVIRASEGSNRLLTVTYPLGTVMPLYAGAPSLVLLVGDTDEQISAAFGDGEHEMYTDATPATLEKAMPIVSRIRNAGYYISRGEFDPDLVSVGVPVFGPDSLRPIAGLGTVLPSSRTSSTLEATMVERLQEAAGSIRAGLTPDSP